MSDLLVGCKVIYNPKEDSLGSREGIIVKVDRGNQKIVWILSPDGLVKTYILDNTITIHPDDVEFIYNLNKNHKSRQEGIENKVNRFEIMDL